MESEDGILEDGEIVDYTPLERPMDLMPKNNGNCQTVPSRLSSEEEDSPSSSESSDSENERRKSLKRRKFSKHAFESTNKTKSKYDIWSVGLQEESLAENLNSFNVEKSDQSRSVESYNYKLKYSLEDGENPMNTHFRSDDSRSSETRTNKRRHWERGNVKMRQRRQFSPEPESKGSSIILFDLAVTAENSDEEVAKDIAAKLSEKKDDLILRVVTEAGKEKSIEIYNETKRIEEDGGMMVMNGSRRRTAGGVFLTLVKRDDDIPNEKIKAIFFDDKAFSLHVKKQTNKHKRNKKTNSLKKTLIEDGLLPPALLTRSELVLRSGGGTDAVEGERAVTNPPPSPATDCDQTNDNGLVTYDDDFLELNVDDDMEVF